jgi:hypothetical protein
MDVMRPVTLVVFSVMTLCACAGHQRPAATAGADPQVAEGIVRLRAATRPFQVIDSAVAAGYARDVADCLVHEHHGAMGYHHANRAYADAHVEVERPEILLYERLADGRYRLNGVEYIVPYRAWPRDSVAPTVMGRPLKHENNLQIWYLHVWAWTENRDGLFADFHPGVSCPAGTGKIFRPSGGQ